MRTDLIQDFPLLQNRTENGQRLVYLDNAATTQKPRAVLDAIRRYYCNFTANPHRGAYALSADATEQYESVRAKVATFIGAASPEEIVFTARTTESINLVALSWAMEHIHEGDEILISVMEHHSNLLPWQQVARRTGAVLRYVEIDASGKIPMEEWQTKLTDRTKLVAVTQMSNVLGQINPVKEIAELAHQKGALILVDAAQSVPHMPVNVRDLDADFLAFSGHKMLGPAGIGVLYAKRAILDSMEPVILGGGIVESVTQQTVCYMDAPWKFEAGTPNVEGAVGLGAAIDYLYAVGFEQIRATEQELTAYAFEKMKALPFVALYGSADPQDHAGIIAFNVMDAHPHDTASILDAYGIAIRAGHHCAQPLMKELGILSNCRLSLYLYNTKEDIDRFIEALSKVREVLGLGA